MKKSENAKKNKNISLESLVKRVQYYNSCMEKYPEKSEMFKKNIERQKNYIVECVLRNSDNKFLGQIIMKG